MCYTVKINGNERSEFNDFLFRMNRDLTDKGELAEMIRLIENIAGKWGIENSLLEQDIIPEDNAHRFVLPFDVQTDRNSPYGLRLYCVILSNNIMLILNGGAKTAQRVRDCPNCEPHFDFANKVAQAVERDKARGKLIIEEDGIYFEEDYTLFI
jgi:hypothetical protein